MSTINEYRSIVGDQVIEELFLLGKKLKGISVQNVNSTALGGGVAEILSRMVPLMKELGVDVWWDVIKGDERFFVHLYYPGQLVYPLPQTLEGPVYDRENGEKSILPYYIDQAELQALHGFGVVHPAYLHSVGMIGVVDHSPL